MAGNVLPEMARWLIIVFVLIALLLEVVLHRMEFWIFKKHPQVQTILRILYRELMILGAISFCFIMYLFSAEPTGSVQTTFEVSHIFVFLFAIFHSLVVAFAIFVSLRLSSHWKRLERMDLIKYLECKEKYQKITETKPSGNSILWAISNPIRLMKFRKLHDVLTFHDIRYQFIYYRNLRPDFLFSKFLRKIKVAILIQLCEIHPVNWLLLVVIIALDIVRIRVGSSKHFNSLFLIAASCFNMILAGILGAKIRSIYWKMTRQPAVYFNGVHVNKLRKELDIVEEEHRIRRESVEIQAPRQQVGSRFSLDSIRRSATSTDAGKTVSRRTSVDSQHISHAPIYQNMAYVPGHGHGHGESINGSEAGDGRYSLDLSKMRPSIDRPALVAVDSSVKPARYNPLPGSSRDVTGTGSSNTTEILLDRARKELERNPYNERTSLDMKKRKT